ncbi:uncharacterized protein LOC119570207 [Penaeus monodon]|uniref:uncharacterized protein LOC119570207 n=1 Tax=Penaeus monodon TaxID=6687 RepID=UPI0018A7CE71|nr:uncharacterized protein LOC119570207 [Penaeus monodon]
MGKTYLRRASWVEAERWSRTFKSYAGTPVTDRSPPHVAVLNSSAMVANKRYDLRTSTQGGARTHHHLKVHTTRPSKAWFDLFIPWLSETAAQFVKEKLLTGIMKKIKKRILTWLCISSEYGTEGQCTPPGRADLMRISRLVRRAGFDNTANTLRWIILYPHMASFPEVQRRVHSRIDGGFPRDFALIQHKSRLPLLEATIQEVLRASSMIHTSPTRSST